MYKHVICAYIYMYLYSLGVEGFSVQVLRTFVSRGGRGSILRNTRLCTKGLLCLGDDGVRF